MTYSTILDNITKEINEIIIYCFSNILLHIHETTDEFPRFLYLGIFLERDEMENKTSIANKMEAANETAMEAPICLQNLS